MKKPKQYKCIDCLKKKATEKVEFYSGYNFDNPQSEYVCPDCADNKFEVCQGCGLLHEMLDTTHTEWHQDIFYECHESYENCDDCEEKCEYCNETNDDRDHRVAELESNWFCDKCVEKFRQENPDKPLINMIGAKHENHN